MVEFSRNLSLSIHRQHYHLATKTRHQSQPSSDLARAEAADDHAPSGASDTQSGYLSAEAFARFSHRALLVYCCVAALSIAAAQISLISTMLYWIVLEISRARSSNRARRTLPGFMVVYTAPVLSWCIISFLTAFTGIDPIRSLMEASKTCVFLLLPLMIYSSLTITALTSRQFLARIESYVGALIFGQCLAALHTVFSSVFPALLPEKVPGPLTESGQLVLILPLVMMSAFYALSSSTAKEDLSVTIFGKRLSPQLYAGLLFLALLVVAWPSTLPGDATLAPLRIGALAAVLLLAIPPLRRGAPEMKKKIETVSKALHLDLFQLVWPASALLFAALLINLKRGPWIGVFFELILLGFILSRRLLVWSVGLFLLVIFAVGPARSRVASFSDHFFISGGRMEMWELGEEIAQRFPMGLGLNNARYMRELDPSIPEAHRHMHNNALNVLVETGWIGLSVYLWWMYAIISFGFRLWLSNRDAKDRMVRQVGAIALGISIAFVGWQISGMFENNFGDGEIRLIALFYMGLLLALGHFVSQSRDSRAL